MKNLSSFWASIYGEATFERIRLRGTLYWSENVYRYYKRGTGRLGDACEIVLEDNEVVVNVKPIYTIERDGTIHEYGQDIIDGIPPGPGKYNPMKGYREKTGYYPGVPASKFFDPWMAEFEPVLEDIVREEVTSGLRDFTIEQVDRGLE